MAVSMNLGSNASERTASYLEAAGLGDLPRALSLFLGLDDGAMSVPRGVSPGEEVHHDGELHLPAPVLSRQMSAELLDRWTGPKRWLDDDDEASAPPTVLPEYQAAMRSVIIEPSLLRSSSLRSSLRHLKEAHSSWPPAEHSFGATIRTLIRRGWPEVFGGIFGMGYDVQGFQASIMETEGNVYSAAMSFHRSLGWEKPYLHAALERLVDVEDSSGLQVIAGMMLRASRECEARKRFVFGAIVNRVPDMTRSDHREEEASLETTEGACRYLREEVLRRYLDDIKLRALRSVFLEPTKMLARCVRDHTLESDADVHGANVYLAILSSTLGMLLDRTPYLHDNAKGCVDFVEAGLQPLRRDSESCWHPNQLGVSWESIPACREPSSRRRVARSRFLFQGRTAMEIANAAVDPSSENATARRRLAPYLEQYCYYFSAPFILKRMFSLITGGDAGEVAERAFSVAFDGMKNALGGVALHDVSSFPEDVRFFCWDLEADPPVFLEKNARMIFEFIGVCRPDNDDIDSSYLDIDDDAMEMVLGTGNGGMETTYLDVD